MLITHGLAMRLFLMRKFHWTVEDFHQVWNPRNCEMWVLERDENSKTGKYYLSSRVGDTPRYGGNKAGDNNVH